MHEEITKESTPTCNVEIVRISKRERTNVGADVTIKKLENGYNIFSEGRTYIATEIGTALDIAISIMADNVDIVPPGTVAGLREQLFRQSQSFNHQIDSMRDMHAHQIEIIAAKAKQELADAKKPAPRKR